MAWVDDVLRTVRRTLRAPAAPDAARPLLPADDAAALIAQARGARTMPVSRPVGQRASGDSLSAWMGRGLDYAESRVYQPGDDLRDLHWRLLARTGKPYIKVHQEEHAPATHVLLDLHPGMAFGTRLRTKAEQAARMALLACATLALAAEGASGAMGLTLWRHVPRALDLGRGLPAMQRLARVLEQERVVPAAKSDLDAAPPDVAAAFETWAQRLVRTLPNGSRLVLVSDAAGWDVPGVDSALWALRSRAEVLVLLVRDPVEYALPSGDALAAATFVDLLQRQTGTLPGDDALRTTFTRLALQRRDALLARWRAHGLICLEAGVEQADSDVLRVLRQVV